MDRESSSCPPELLPNANADVLSAQRAIPGDGSVRFRDAFNQPGSTGSAPGTISGRTSAQAGSSSAADPDSCSTPRSSATYTVEGLAATVVTGISRLRLGPSEFTPSRLT